MSTVSLSIFTDGGARGNPGTAGIGVVVVDSDSSTVIYEHSSYIGETTNNVAEYSAVITALEWLSRFCKQQTVQNVSFYLDSLLVVEQVNLKWKVKDANLQKLHAQIRTQIKTLPCFISFQHIPRAQNDQADKLVNQALDAYKLND